MFVVRTRVVAAAATATVAVESVRGVLGGGGDAVRRRHVGVAAGADVVRREVPAVCGRERAPADDPHVDVFEIGLAVPRPEAARVGRPRSRTPGATGGVVAVDVDDRVVHVTPPATGVGAVVRDGVVVEVRLLDVVVATVALRADAGPVEAVVHHPGDVDVPERDGAPVGQVGVDPDAAGPGALDLPVAQVDVLDEAGAACTLHARRQQVVAAGVDALEPDVADRPVRPLRDDLGGRPAGGHVDEDVLVGLPVADVDGLFGVRGDRDRVVALAGDRRGAGGRERGRRPRHLQDRPTADRWFVASGGEVPLSRLRVRPRGL